MDRLAVSPPTPPTTADQRHQPLPSSGPRPGRGNNLYVADGNNNRVLYYPSGTTTATRVYGQAGSFTSNSANNTSGTSSVVSANSLNQPYGVNIGSSGNIYVTDTNNNRELEFQTALSITAQPPSIVATGTAFSTAATLIDVDQEPPLPILAGLLRWPSGREPRGPPSVAPPRSRPVVESPLSPTSPST